MITKANIPPTYIHHYINQTGVIQQVSLPQPEVFLIYAFYLAGLTYFLGVIFYALPIPVEGVKQWAPKLIKDSIYVLVWISIYQYIIYLAQYILKLLHISWTGYIETLTLELAVISAIYFGLSALQGVGTALASGKAGSGITGAIASKLGGTSIAGVLSAIGSSGVLKPFVEVTDVTLMVYLSIYLLSTFIYYAMPWLITFGIFMMSLPFRLGRGVGATFIAIALVFYVGLPLMPTFAGDMAGALFAGAQSGLNSLVSNDSSGLAHIILPSGAPSILQSIINGFTSFLVNVAVWGSGFGEIYYLYFAIEWVIVYFIIARIVYAFILLGIAGKLAGVIAESAGGVPIKLERII